MNRILRCLCCLAVGLTLSVLVGCKVFFDHVLKEMTDTQRTQISEMIESTLGHRAQTEDNLSELLPNPRNALGRLIL